MMYLLARAEVTMLRTRQQPGERHLTSCQRPVVRNERVERTTRL
jgi:hypothetical protein